MNTAEQLIQNTGKRSTPVRSAILDVLLNAEDVLSHSEVLEHLQQSGTFDRVTVYRALDWLVAQGLVHKVAGAGRAWRFQVTRSESMHRHAHFQCHHCHKVFCLPEVQPALPKELPSNFSIDSIELNIKGICADCGRAMMSQ